MNQLRCRILVDASYAAVITQGVLGGVTEYVREKRLMWEPHGDTSRGFRRRVAEEPGVFSGLITILSPVPEGLEVARALRATGLPVVNLLHDLHEVLPSVLPDEFAIGRAGAQYLMEVGGAEPQCSRHFAFLARDTDWGRGRQQGFCQALAEAGLPCDVGPDAERPLRGWEEEAGRAAVGRWLGRLGKPAAVMCANDFDATTLLSAALEAGLRVPEELAVLGVDDDPSLCESAAVPLSSVSQDFARLGFLAAGVLDALMRGESPPDRALLVGPGPVTTRRSTDSCAGADPNVALALRLIRQHAAEGMTVKQLLERVPVSRTWLEQQFREVLGHTPGEEIQRLRLTAVRDLLLRADLTLAEIARRTGFAQVKSLSRAFRNTYGIAPTTFRDGSAASTAPAGEARARS